MSSDNTKDNASTNDNKTMPPLPVTPPSQTNDKNPPVPQVTPPIQVTNNNHPTSPIFSRATLKAMPEQGKQNYLDLI
jgi:hypothetical protein